MSSPSPRKELQLIFPRALLLSVYRNKRFGWARFRCLWADSLVEVFGWREPDGADDVVKHTTLKATRLELLQSPEEIGAFPKLGEADIVTIENFKLVRREAEPDTFVTTVFFTAQIKPACIDALENLEQFLTTTVKPGKLTIHYPPIAKPPVQLKTPGTAHETDGSRSSAPEATAKRTHSGVADEMETRKAAVQ